MRLSVRPQHPQSDPLAQGLLKKVSPATIVSILPEHARTKPLEIWFQDETRVGQQGTLTRLLAKRESRLRAPRNLRHEWAHIFGEVCPARRATAALVLPYANTEAFSLHLAEISKEVATGAHAILILDGAGYHAATVKAPDNITLLPLPSYAPELTWGV